MNLDYWSKQSSTKPLFPDIEWGKPERRDQAGRLGIIGGNKLGFAAVAEAYSGTLQAGVGQVRVLLPATLKKAIPAIGDTIFAASTNSGGLAKDAIGDLKALGDWSTGLLLIGDAGRNSETAVVYEHFITEYQGPLIITRDAIDLVKNNSQLLVERPDTLLVGSFAQVQKLFQAVYYPKILTFSMQLLQLVEALHKFTITYPITIVTLHQDQVVIASRGQVVSQEWTNPMRIWRGETASRIAAYYLWNNQHPLQAASAALANSTKQTPPSDG